MEQRKKIKWWKRFIKNIIAVKDKHQVETKENITNSSYDIEIKSVKITDIKIKL